LYADHFEAGGVDLFRAVCENDLEGIVAKRKDGLYTPEETSWVKIKNPLYASLADDSSVARNEAVLPELCN
jgi:ATP-dependent DNA ligase